VSVRRSLSAVLLVVALALSTAIAAPAHAAPQTSSAGLVLINELNNGGSRSDADSFFELRNWDDHAIDLSRWQVFRCSPLGLRSNVGRPEADFSGIVLEPGQILTVSRVGMVGDLHVTMPYDVTGFGLYLEGPGDELVDAVGVYPNKPWPTQSECTTGSNLPNSLSFAFDESWQRVDTTGDVARDFVKAPATLGAANATESPRAAHTDVVISEFAPSGPASVDDEFVELRNAGTETADISGWQLCRCTGTGRLRPDAREYTAPAGTSIEPGGYFVLGGSGFTGRADATYATELADVTSGVYLATEGSELVDRVAVSNYADSACQEGDAKLPGILDFVAAESYQLSPTGFIVAERTPGKKNRSSASSVFLEPFQYEDGVAISELGTDPGDGPFTQHNFVELGNYGDSTVDISGWTIRRCELTGIRSRDVQATIAKGTRLAPGESFVAARAGTIAADATYDTTLNFLGTGIWIANREGERVDSVGVYAVNEMDDPLVTVSPCTKGLALTTFLPDRTLGETFQRTRFTGSDADDFITGPATPGVIDLHEWVDPTLRVAGGVESFETPKAAPVETLPAEARDAEVIESWEGVSGAPLTTEVGTDEVPSTGEVVDDAWGYPYQRFVLDSSELKAGQRVYWSGSTVGRNELQLSVWSPATSSWRLLDAGTGDDIHLSGAVEQNELGKGRMTLLVQNGPRTTPTLSGVVDGKLENPANYDFAISHITDTQYLSESYPEVYAQLVSWIVDNAVGRKIEFATHTGDLVQNWVDPEQNEERAHAEFQRASDIQSILDDAGMPNSVLPGNHDNKRGVDNSLFNEYFAPERYENTVPIAPGDNSANYTTFEHQGARFLMLSIGYAYGEREIAWAEDVVASHPDYNVVISTHEHVTPVTREVQAQHSVNSRWISRGGELWDRVIAPNRNVIIVLSGHFHGLGQIHTENAGGIEGHDVVELLADYQEFRTHTGERATGFQRLLQLDLASSTVAVDTFSATLDESWSYPYDYRQFLPDNGLATSASNMRPWNIVAIGTQDRYTEEDDEFTASVGFQYPKRVATSSLATAPPEPAPSDSSTNAGSSRDWLEIFRTTRT
jgi:hypothetical protein